MAGQFCGALTAHGIVVRLLEDEDAPELDLGADGPLEVVPADADAGCGLRAGRGHRRRRHDPAGRRARPASPAPRCSGSTSATSASSPRPSPTTSSTSIDAIIDRRYTAEERLTHRRRGLPRQGAGHLDLGAQRGERREGRPRADARGGRRGRRPAAVPVGVRRRRLRDADRVDGVQLLRRRPDRLARGRGAAPRADQRPRAVRPADGGLADLGAGGRGDRAAPRVPGVLWCDGRRTVDLPPGARIEVRRGAHAGPAGPAARGAVHRPAGREVRPAGQRLARRRRASGGGGEAGA